jgi:peptide/nickel transport system permease protein
MTGNVSGWLPRLKSRACAAGLIVLVAVVLAATLQTVVVPAVADQRSSPDGGSSHAGTLAANDTLRADPGPNQTVLQGTEVTLDGSQSTGNITNYTWTFGYGGLNETFIGMITKFKFALPGIYDVTLNVTDGKGNYSTGVVVITVQKEKINILATYWKEILIIAAVVAVMAFFYIAISRGFKFIPEATQEKWRLGVTRWRGIMSQVLHNGMGLAGVIILIFFIGMAVFGPTLAPEKIDPAVQGPNGQFEKPSPEHWLGTDVYRYDIFSELLYGARTSMIVGVFSAIIASVLGAAVGLYSGYVGGWKDEVIMRGNDVVLSIPWLVLMIVVAAILQKIDLTGIILIIGLTGWSTTARMVRASVLSIKQRQFVERARAVGASDMSIIRRHVMPNAFPLVFANTILTVAISILSEATLSFLGLRPVNTITWGTMLSRASEADAFHIGLQGWIIIPGLCIVVVVLGFTLLGYALDDIMNPKLRKR